MYKVIKIGNREYKLEYSIEASLYKDCVSSIADLIVDLGIAENAKDIKAMLKGMASVPQTTLTLFYAGLMEHHGVYGDGSVPDINAAKKIIAEYLKEHKESGDGDFYSIMNLCVEQMGEDGFFKLTGLENLLQEVEPKRKSAKTPTDHQKKNAKVIEKQF